MATKGIIKSHTKSTTKRNTIFKVKCLRFLSAPCLQYHTPPSWWQCVHRNCCTRLVPKKKNRRPVPAVPELSWAQIIEESSSVRRFGSWFWGKYDAYSDHWSIWVEYILLMFFFNPIFGVTKHFRAVFVCSELYTKPRSEIFYLRHPVFSRQQPTHIEHDFSYVTYEYWFGTLYPVCYDRGDRNVQTICALWSVHRH